MLNLRLPLPLPREALASSGQVGVSHLHCPLLTWSFYSKLTLEAVLCPYSAAAAMTILCPLSTPCTLLSPPISSRDHVLTTLGTADLFNSSLSGGHAAVSHCLSGCIFLVTSNAKHLSWLVVTCIYSVKYSWPVPSMGFTSAESTNHETKIFE